MAGRHEELNEVIRTVQNGGKLFFIGPRRYGKTSILQAAEDKLAKEGALVLRCDAENYPTLDLLAAAIVRGTAHALESGIEETSRQIQRFFVTLRPELSFNVNDKKWNVRFGVEEKDEPGHHLALLIDAIEGLEKLACSLPKDRPAGLMIDEFQKAIELGGENSEAHLRAVIQRHKRTGYIFAGSKTKFLTAMTMDAARPFYRLGGLCFLGPVPRTDFIPFMRKKFLMSGFSFPVKNGDESLSLILDLAQDVPCNVQMLAHACWDRLRSGKIAKEKALHRTVVEQSLDSLIRQCDSFYTQLWNDLTSIQQKVLLAVIAERGVNLQSMKVVRMVNKGASTIQRSIGLLTERTILREDEQPGISCVKFEDPFFAHWIRRFTSGWEEVFAALDRAEVPSDFLADRVQAVPKAG